jgi:hypothetical protein
MLPVAHAGRAICACVRLAAGSVRKSGGEDLVYECVEFCIDVLSFNEEGCLEAGEDQFLFLFGVVPHDFHAHSARAPVVAVYRHACGLRFFSQLYVLRRGDPRKYLRCARCHVVLPARGSKQIPIKYAALSIRLQTVPRRPEIACKNEGEKCCCN